MSEPGRKDDSGKLRYDLIDPYAIAWLVASLTYGAYKYKHPFADTREALRRIENICTCGKTTNQRNVTPIAGTQQEGCASPVTPHSIPKQGPQNATQTEFRSTELTADHATTASSKSEILTTQTVNEPTLLGGMNSTQRRSLALRDDAAESHVSAKPVGLATEEESSHLSGLRSKTNSRSLQNKETHAPSAETKQSAHMTSTTITSPESSVDCYADDATRGSVSWENLKSDLNKHSPTCEIHRRIAWEDEILVELGDGNWAEVKRAKDRYYSALMRHIEAWRAGQDDDDESGLPHLANAMFCVMCLTAMNAPRDMKIVRDRTLEAIKRWREISGEGR